MHLDGQPQRVIAATYYPTGTPMAGAIGPSFDAVSAAPAVYRLVVQPPDGTGAGRTFTVAIAVKRPGATVHAPPTAAAAPVAVTGTRSAPPASGSVDDRLRMAIARGRSETGLPIAAGHTIRRAADPSQVEIDAQFEVTGAVAPPLTSLMGLVADGGQVRVAAPKIEPAGEGRYLVNLSLSVPPGPQRLRLAVADAHGALGALEYPVTADLRRMGPIVVSDLLRWTIASEGRTPWHLPAVPPGVTAIAAGLELYESTGPAPADLLVKFELAGRAAGAAAAIERIVAPDAREQVLVAEAEFPLDRLAAGEYLLRATLMSGTTVLGTATAPLVKR